MTMDLPDNDSFGLPTSDPISRQPIPVEECRVSNYKSLAKYREKREEWLSWHQFRPGDPNSIEGQMMAMLFVDLGYRILVRPGKRGTGKRGKERKRETA